MAIPSLRVALRELSDDEWRQILNAGGAFQTAMRQGSRPHRGPVGPDDVRAWIAVPARSDGTLDFAVRHTAHEHLTDGEDVDDTDNVCVHDIPTDLSELEAWLADVTATSGAGPAKVCLLAAKAGHGRDGAAAVHHDDLLHLIKTTEYRGRLEADDIDGESGGASIVSPDDETSDPSDDELPITDPPREEDDLADLTSRLEDLRTEAGRLVDDLLDVQKAIRVGAGLPSAVQDRLRGYASRRQSVFEEAAEATGREPVDFDECRRALDEETARREKQRRHDDETSERIQSLRGELADVDAQLEAATARVGAALVGVRAEIVAELKALGVDDDGPIAEPDEPDESMASPDGPDEDRQRPDGSDASGPAGPQASDQASTESSQSEPEPGAETGPVEQAADSRTEDAASEHPDVDAAPAAMPSTEEMQAPESRAITPTVVEPAAPDADEASEPIEPTHSAKHGRPLGHASLKDDAARLVADHRPMAAWWLLSVADADGLLADAVRFHAMAFASGPGAVSATDAIVSGTHLPVSDLEGNRAAAVAAMTGAARAGLAAGWTHPPLLEGLLPAVGLDEDWQQLFNAIVEAVYNGYVHHSDRPGVGGLTRAQTADRARTLTAELGSSRIAYHRATRVLQRLLRRDQPLGDALYAVEQWGSGHDSALPRIKHAAATLRTGRSRIRLIDDADSAVASPQQRHNPIVATARQQLDARIDQVALLAQAALDASSRVVSQHRDHDARERLITFADQVSENPGTCPLERAMLLALRSWILNPDIAWPEHGDNADSLAWYASLPIADPPRDHDGLPDQQRLIVHAVRDVLLNPASPATLIEVYLGRGDLAAAAACAGDDPTLVAQVDAETERWPARLQRMARDLEVELARARSEHNMDDDDIAAAEGTLKAATAYQGDRYDLAEAQLDQVRRDLTRSVREEAERLRGELARCDRGPNDADVSRILALIDAGDLATAREYLFFLNSGRSLPEPEAGGTPLLEQFQALLVGQSAVGTADDVYQVAGGPAERQMVVKHGLRGWRSLETQRVFREQIPEVLRLLGLEQTTGPESFRNLTEPGSGGSRTFQVRGVPMDRSIVPGLGSGAPRYNVTVVAHERRDPVQVLQLIPDVRANDANILLIPRLLTEPERRAHLVAARRRRVNALVIDSAVAGFVAAKAPGSFAAVQELTLPFSTFSHYTPAQSGVVPDEVFVGRADEQAQIVDPAGSLFVYGGRQLGKSALLRRIERSFTRAPDRFAVYIDLKAKMIGEAHDPAHLWSVLLEEFKGLGVIGPKFTSASPQVVTAQLRAWLNEDETRRILLLLDEADLFLESEARQRREGNRVVRFANLQPLKDLMESTERRFKPVFAGLHQVQRFQEISNTPLAHGGRDILVGPLDRAAALELVEKPMAALGYRFDNRDLVFRLLAFTNYQANLIQIVCDRLIGQLSKRTPAVGQPPQTITSDDVDRVIEDAEVRRYLAERFRLTIQLEDRYLVIALVLAVLSFEDQFRGGYDPMELLEWCREYWPGGFDDMTAREFGLYLDEMRGLGVLVRRGDLVAVRSPNVVAMLGSKAELTQQLHDDADRFELPHDFNPRASRRIVRPATGKEMRSPLTEQDLRVLLPRNGSVGGVTVVLGSPATGLGDVSTVLQAVAEERGLLVAPVPAADFPEWVTASATGARARTTLPVVDASDLDRQAGEDLLARAVSTVRRRKDQRIIVLLGPTGGPVVESWSAQIDLVPLERWNGEALRSLGEGLFAMADNREKALAATSGWPQLIDEVDRRTSKGEALLQVVESVSAFPTTDTEAARFLSLVGASDDLPLLAEWVSLLDDDEQANPAELDEVFGDGIDGAGATFAETAARLAAIGVMSGEPPALVLDPVVRRAVRRLSA